MLPRGGLDSPDRQLLVLAYLGFVSLGLPDAVLGLVWPPLRDDFALSQAALGAALGVGATAYFISGLVAGRLLVWLGVGPLLAASTGLVAVGVTGYASAPAFAIFLLGAILVGFGSGAVDTGLNAHAAAAFSPRHMTWLHAAYSLGAALGPCWITLLMARGIGWRAGYASIALVLGLLGLAFFAQRRQWMRACSAEPPKSAPQLPVFGVLKRKVVRLHMLLFFLYTGIEIGTGQWSFTVLTEARGLASTVAATWTTLYWASLFAGRVLFGFVLPAVGPARLVRASIAVAGLASFVFALPGVPVVVNGCGLVALGLAFAPIFPALMSLTPERVGKDAAAHAIGFQVSAATLGVAAIPSLGGFLAESTGAGAVPLLMAGCAAALCLVHERLIRWAPVEA